MLCDRSTSPLTFSNKIAKVNVELGKIGEEMVLQLIQNVFLKEKVVYCSFTGHQGDIQIDG